MGVQKRLHEIRTSIGQLMDRKLNGLDSNAQQPSGPF